MSQPENNDHLPEFYPDDDYQHIEIAVQSKCRQCKNKPCLTICPSGVFIWNNCDNDPVLVFYKQCVECGACRLVCPYENIKLTWPEGGFGVAFHEG